MLEGDRKGPAIASGERGFPGLKKRIGLSSATTQPERPPHWVGINLPLSLIAAFTPREGA